ncbi:MAG: sigma-70 family RNA polymerase sigma factor [Planctomycetes bacterium]|nr:sigma-70 family RNA polymerase sigma factor [Planctomycetota bacterium]
MTLPTSGRSGENDNRSSGVERRSLPAEHERWLRTVILARTGSADAVDEVLQEVAVAFLTGRSLPAEPDAMAPWLYRVAVRQSLLFRRRLGRQRRLKKEFAERTRPAEFDSRTADPLDWLLAAERRQLVRTALERLPAKEAEILLLKYTENWSYRDLAAHLDVSESAVESRLHRARARLRRELVKLQVVEVAS